MHQEADSVPLSVDPSCRRRSQGTEVMEQGVHFRTWCKHDRADVIILDDAGVRMRCVRLEPEQSGYFSGVDEAGAAGDRYQYRFDESPLWPDPASCYQPDGVHGPSMVVDATSFVWTDESWSQPALSDLVIYELHVGAFTPHGTFRSAIERLPHLVALGVTAIELMPIADFPGERNWGYDGVMLYAPARTYGAPDDLRALVDAAHAHGLAVILDVVYNHLGPDGNYMGVYHDGYYAQPDARRPGAPHSITRQRRCVPSFVKTCPTGCGIFISTVFVWMPPTRFWTIRAGTFSRRSRNWCRQTAASSLPRMSATNRSFYCPRNPAVSDLTGSGLTIFTTLFASI
ncbi:MAG TPA: alpha-amylase family glycosyl hydrolase [Chthoniobacterales bacterium]|nr:alpha-amylase family glycosyl hydrolase [Chthoniobacterales bacterium]